jgi:tetratricopeptide (TPR) repeat protein
MAYNKNTAAKAAERADASEPSGAPDALRAAVAHYKKGEWAMAAVAAGKVAETHARCTAAYHLMALALENLGQRSQAFEMFERALATDPTNAGLYLDIANAAWKSKFLGDAEKAFRAYIELSPDCPKGPSGLAGCLRDAGRLDEALSIAAGALHRMPQAAGLWNVRGTIMGEQLDFAGAIACYAKAQRLAPKSAEAFHNAGHAQSHTGNFQEATVNYARALELSDNDRQRAEIRHARALTLAAAGKLGEAWMDYEERHNPAFAQSTAFAIPAPRWQGEDLTGCKLLVVGEQGLGDEIMFASMIPDLLAKTGPTGKVMLAVDQRLVPLFHRSFPQAHVGHELHRRDNGKHVRLVPWATDDLAPDSFTPIGSPLQHLRSSIDAFPPRAYLKPDPARVRYWIDRLASLGPGPYVGISWTSMLKTPQRAKFFSALKDWAPVLETTAVKFVNLQYGDCQAELATVSSELGIKIHTFADIDLTNDIDGKAALCDALDLVVSAPTAPAMLAAAVGTQTWLLTAGPLWQQLGTDRYPWYANTRVLTPQKFADWPALMQRLACELEDFASR